MDERLKYVLKVALETLAAAGGAGVTEKALRSQIDLASGMPASAEDIEATVAMLRDRGWMEWHMEKFWHTKRWTVTPRGMEALEGLS